MVSLGCDLLWLKSSYSNVGGGGPGGNGPITAQFFEKQEPDHPNNNMKLVYFWLPAKDFLDFFFSHRLYSISAWHHFQHTLCTPFSWGNMHYLDGTLRDQWLTGNASADAPLRMFLLKNQRLDLSNILGPLWHNFLYNICNTLHEKYHILYCTDTIYQYWL